TDLFTGVIPVIVVSAPGGMPVPRMMFPIARGGDGGTDKFVLPMEALVLTFMINSATALMVVPAGIWGDPPTGLPGERGGERRAYGTVTSGLPLISVDGSCALTSSRAVTVVL